MEHDEPEFPPRDQKQEPGYDLRRDNEKLALNNGIIALEGRRNAVLNDLHGRAAWQMRSIALLAAEGRKFKGALPQQNQLARETGFPQADIDRHLDAVKSSQVMQDGKPVEPTDAQSFWGLQSRANLKEFAAFNKQMENLSEKFEKAKTLGEKSNIAQVEEIIATQFVAYTARTIADTAIQLRGEHSGWSQRYSEDSEHYSDQAQKLRKAYEKNGGQLLKEVERYHGSLESADRAQEQQRAQLPVRIAPTNGVVELTPQPPQHRDKEAQGKYDALKQPERGGSGRSGGRGR